MRRAFGLVVLCLFIVPPAFADAELTPQSKAIVDRLDAALSDPAEQRPRLEVFRQIEPDLKAAGRTDTQAEALRAALAIALESEASLDYLQSAIGLLGKPPTKSRMLEAAGELLATSALLHNLVPPTRLHLNALGRTLVALEKLGITREAIAGLGLPDTMAYYDTAIEMYRAGVPLADLQASQAGELRDAEETLIKFFADLATPAPLTTERAHPLIQFATGLRNNAFGGLNEVVRAGPNPEQVEASRLHVLQQGYNVLSDDGGARRASLQDWFGEYAKKLPGAEGPFNDVLTEPTDRPSPRAGLPEPCQAVTCDCGNLELDIGGAFKAECVKSEREILMQCIAHQGSLKDLYCHPTASGPAAFPEG